MTDSTPVSPNTQVTCSPSKRSPSTVSSPIGINISGNFTIGNSSSNNVIQIGHTAAELEPAPVSAPVSALLPNSVVQVANEHSVAVAQPDAALLVVPQSGVTANEQKQMTHLVKQLCARVKGALSTDRTAKLTLEGLRSASQRKQKVPHLQAVRDDYNAITQLVRHAKMRPLLTHNHTNMYTHMHTHVHSTF
jgi:hypothetical protein